jgi:hypothetical protein
MMSLKTGRNLSRMRTGRNWSKMKTGRKWKRMRTGRNWSKMRTGRKWRRMRTGRKWSKEENGRKIDIGWKGGAKTGEQDSRIGTRTKRTRRRQRTMRNGADKGRNRRRMLRIGMKRRLRTIKNGGG